MNSIILVAVALTVGGLLIVWLSGQVPGVLLKAVAYWAGVAVTVLGLILLLFPVLAWAYRNITAAFGLQG